MGLTRNHSVLSECCQVPIGGMFEDGKHDHAKLADISRNVPEIRDHSRSLLQKFMPSSQKLLTGQLCVIEIDQVGNQSDARRSLNVGIRQVVGDLRDQFFLESV